MAAALVQLVRYAYHPDDMNIESSITVTTAGTMAVALLADATNLPRARIKDAMTKGAVWLTHDGHTRRLRRAKAVVQPGDTLAIYYSAEILAEVPPEPTLIVDESEFSVWYKPPGLISSGSRYGDHSAINRWVEKQLDRPVFLVHRLDRFTSGLMLLAHGKRTAATLSAAFQAREVEKRYKAIVIGEFAQELALDTPLDGKFAKSIVTPLEYREGFTLVDVLIETGRKHQIRRHLSTAGYPVVGDRLYGGGADAPLQLTAYFLAFTDPVTGEHISFDLPASFHPMLAALPAIHSGISN